MKKKLIIFLAIILSICMLFITNSKLRTIQIFQARYTKSEDKKTDVTSPTIKSISYSNTNNTNKNIYKKYNRNYSSNG